MGIEADNEEEVTTKRRSSNLENVLNVKVNDVLDLSSESMAVPEESPNFQDSGWFSPCTGGLGSFTLGKRPLGFPTSSILFAVAKAHPRS